MIEIWLADFIFYYKQKAKEKMMNAPVVTFTEKDVITKRIPVRFIINEGEAYHRATKDMLKTFLANLQDDSETGLKKFTIVFTKKIGEVNGR